MRGIFVVFAFLLLPLVSAEYYADVTLTVGSSGEVAVEGITNHPDLQPRVTDEFTSKNREYWLVNVSIPDTFDELVLTVVLPPDATLNYVSAKSAVNIYSDGDRVVIKRVASNSSIALAAQYRLERDRQVTAWWFAGLFALVVLVALAYLYWPRSKRKAVAEKKADTPVYYDGLPQRQREIIALLQKAGGQLTQKQIEQGMSIPKSSVSRNLDSLYRRGIIKKESFGMTNVIMLQK